MSKTSFANGTTNRITRACGIILLWAVAAVALPAQTLKTLHTFDNTDGASPNGGLIQATDGNLYGTTAGGGPNTNNACTGYHYTGCGTVFRITPSGALTTLYSFCSLSNCADGYVPFGALVEGLDGNFYGTTVGGGANNDCVVGTCGGTVFKVTPSGILTTLYSFAAGVDGFGPRGALIQGTDGNFYGVTNAGGSTSGMCALFNGCGTVYKITPGGTLTTLHTFNFTDGTNSLAGLVQGGNGDFYGASYNGGANDPPLGLGTVFKITPGGTLTTLYSFCSQTNCADGIEPFAALIQGTDGNFYGTTGFGGDNGQVCGQIGGCGTAFKITPSGTLTTLHSFDFTDGDEAGGLVQGTDGNFYGTSVFGGTGVCGVVNADGCGTVFKMTPSGTLTTLYSFDRTNAHGTEPVGALAQDTNGTFYGSTGLGPPRNGVCYENEGCGTIFSLSAGLGPFVATRPSAGTIGMAVNILGTNLTGATKVTFHGIAATFTVISGSLITSAVPAGATTGTVKVLTPTGTLKSNIPFTVLP